MANRDWEGSPYERNDGRYESRGRDDWRDQSNRGSRDWDRRDDDFRRDQGYSAEGRGQGDYGRGRNEGFYGQYGQSRNEGDYGRGRSEGYYGGQYGRDEGDYGRGRNEGFYGQYGQSRGGYSPYYERGGSDYGSSRYGQGGTINEGYDPSRQWFDDRAEGPRRGGGSSGGSQSIYGRDWGHAQQPYDTQSGDYEGGSSSYSGQGFRRPRYAGGFGRDEQSQRSYGIGVSSWGDRDQEQGRHTTRPYSRWETDGGQPERSQHGRSHHDDDESWGQQLREGFQHAASRVKRVFRGPKNYKRSDERIREDVSDRLAHQHEVDPSDLEVHVSSGEVTLTGTVQNRREKYMAEEIADNVGGVTEVHNQLRIARAGASAQASSSTPVAGAAQNEGGRNRNARA